MNMDQCSALIHLHSTPAPSLQYYDRPQKSLTKTTGHHVLEVCVMLRNLWYSDSNQTKGAALSDKSSGPYMSVPLRV